MRAALVLLLALVAPALGADVPQTSPDMWSRVRGVQPKAVDLKPTPSPTAPPKLALKECLELAFKQNAGFRQNLAQLLDARQNLWVAAQATFYTATGSAERQKNPGGDAGDSFAAGFVTRWENVTGGSFNGVVSSGTQDIVGSILSQRPSFDLSYDQPLLRGAGLASSRSERLRSARNDLCTQELSFYDSSQQLAQNLIADYCDVVLARGEVDIAQQSVDRAKKGYDINYAKFTGEGMKRPDEKWVTQVAEIDVDQSRLSWEQSKQDLISRQQAYRDAVDSLLLDMGYAPGSTPELTTTIPHTPQDYDVEALVKQALAESTQLARLDLNREDAVASLRIARSEARPDLIASLGVTDLGETLEGTTLSTGWMAGLRVEVPLLDRSRTENIDHSVRALAVLDQQTVAARDQVTQEVQRQIRSAASTRARMDIGKQALALAQKNRDAAQGMYDEGLSDYLRVMDADSRLVQAQSSLLQEQVQYFLTTIRVRRALGEDITQGLPE